MKNVLRLLFALSVFTFKGFADSSSVSIGEHLSELKSPWVWLMPQSMGYRFGPIVFGSGMFVSMGNNGSVHWSKNGTEWKTALIDTTDQYRDLVFGNGRFAAIGDSGLIWSENGSEWFKEKKTPYRWPHLAFQDSLFNTVIDDPKESRNLLIVKSKDAVTWSGGTDFDYNRDRSVYAFGKWFRYAEDGYKDPKTKVSENALLISADRTVWKAVLKGDRNSFTVQTPVLLNGVLICPGGKNRIYTSRNGTDWDSVTIGTNGYPYFKTPIFAKGLWMIPAWYDSKVIVSSDAKSWKEITLPNNLRPESIVFGNGIFLAQNGAQRAISSDGLIWKEGSESVAGRKIAGEQITYDGTAFTMLVRSEDPRVYRSYQSKDGIEWVPDSLQTFGHNTYLFAKKGTTLFLRSDDEEAWVGSRQNGKYHWKDFSELDSSENKQPDPESESEEYSEPEAVSYGVFRVFHGNGRFIALGENEILWSDDGNHWEYGSAGSSRGFGSALWKYGKWFAVGEGGMIESSDGKQWRALSDSTVKNWNLRTILSTPEGAMVFGKNLYCTNDGVHWQKRYFPADENYGTASASPTTMIVSSEDAMLACNFRETKEQECDPADTIALLLISEESKKSFTISVTDTGLTAKAVDLKTELSYTAPSLPTYGKTLHDFVPDGWFMRDSAVGDLNKDGKDDAVIVIEREQMYRTLDEDGYAETYAPRMTAVLFANHSVGYNRFLQNGSFIPVAVVGSNLEDPYCSVEIKKGVLKFSFQLFCNSGSWTASNDSFTFRWQNGDFYLIGSDTYTYVRNTGETTTVSTNYSTRKSVTTTGNYADESVKEKSVWETLSPAPLAKLREMNSFMAD